MDHRRDCVCQTVKKATDAFKDIADAYCAGKIEHISQVDKAGVRKLERICASADRELQNGLWEPLVNMPSSDTVN